MMSPHDQSNPEKSRTRSQEAEAQAEIAALRQACRRQQAQLQETQVQLLEVLNSTWWRIGEGPRLLGRRYPKLARIIRFVTWSTGKSIYYARRGVLLERLADYYRRQKFMMLARHTNLAATLDLKLQRNARDGAKLEIPFSPAPIVSIIIPAYGNVDMTLRCLASIAAAPPSFPVEVILADDASGDPAVKVYEKLSRLRFINRAENLGFIRSCNDAVKQSKGEFVFLLNNDAEVMPGAIDALLDLFRTKPDAGLVGARLLYADGRQQEAGAIIWKDGTAWNYGRFDDPRRPEYGYVREVDYISGAAIMLPRALWDSLGGFDERYVPAYCEDSDLAMRVRQAGKKVYYQPKAWVVHHEGISHGTDVTKGVKAYQVTNTRKLVDRWRNIFETAHYENGTRIMRARDRAAQKKIVLVIDHYVPEPDRDAGSRTIVKFIETLLAMGRVVKFWPANGREAPVYTEALQQMGVEVLYGPWENDFERWIKINGNEIDEVLLSRPTIAPMFLPDLRKYTRAPVVFYGHDLHFMRMEREAETVKDLTKYNAAQEMKELERRVWLSVDHVLYPSADEVRTVAQIEPSVHSSAVAPYAFDSAVARTHPPAAPEIIFVAGFRHSPNIDAAAWLCFDIMPRIRAIRPDARLSLIGSHPTKAVQALADNNVDVTGYVTDEELTRRYAAARVVVAPVRFGAGVKMKVVEGLREGVPLVTTTVGVQGLVGIEGIGGIIDIHDDPDAFAKAVLRLLSDDALWIARSLAQTDYVAKHFSSACMRDDLEAAFTTVSGNIHRAVA